MFLSKKGHIFESETDTEIIAKLVLHIHRQPEHSNILFSQLVELVCQQLEGAFALVFKSTHYPGEVEPKVLQTLTILPCAGSGHKTRLPPAGGDPG